MIGDDRIDQLVWEGTIKRRRHAVKFVRGLFMFVAFFALLQLAFQFSMDIVTWIVVGAPLHLSLAEWQHVFGAALVTGVLGSLAVGTIVYSSLGLMPKGTRMEFLERQTSSPFGTVLTRQQYRALVAEKAEWADKMEGAHQLGWDIKRAVEESVSGPSRCKENNTLATCWAVLRYSSHSPDVDRAMGRSDDWQDLIYELAHQAYTADVRRAAEAIKSEKYPR